MKISIQRIAAVSLPALVQQLRAHYPGTVCLGHDTPFPSDRYCIVSAAPINEARVQTGQPTTKTRLRDQIAAIEARHAALKCAPEPSIPFVGGLIGYVGYDMGNIQAAIEPASMLTAGGAPLPVLHIGLYLWALVTDHHQSTQYLVFHADCPPTLRTGIEALITSLASRPPSLLHSSGFQLTSHFHHDMTRSTYTQAVERIQQYIKEGDCYQVNFAQRLSAGCRGNALDAYFALAKNTKTPFSAYLDAGDHEILSFSPEQFIACDTDGNIQTQPIKGTRPRSAIDQEDRKLKEALINSPKDRAENLMIVDLLRNDIGKYSRTGSVKVTRLFEIESFSNVHHLVSTITGKLRADCTPLDLLTGCFPGGSITGAPKRRAMQIIRELEPHGRGPYCGSIFYYSLDGRLDSNIAIRTLLRCDDQIYCWGGGGIVSDSQTDSEYHESMTKISHLVSMLESRFFSDQGAHQP